MYLTKIIFNIKKRIIFSLFFILLIKFLMIVPVILLGKIIDHINNKDLDMDFYLFVLIVVTMLYYLFSPSITKYTTRTIQIIIYKLSLSITKNMFAKEYDFYKNSKIGGIIRQTERGILSYEKLLTFIFNLIIPNIFTLFIISLYMCISIGFLAYLVCLAFGCTTFYILTKLIAKRRKYIDHVNDCEDAIGEVFAETFMAAKSIKYRNIYEEATTKLKQSYKNYGISSATLSFHTEIIKSLQYMSTHISTVLIIIIGVFLIAHNPNDFTVGDLVILIGLSTLMMASIISLSEGYKEYDQFKADGIKLNELLNLPELKDKNNGLGLEKFEILKIKPFFIQLNPQKNISNCHEIIIKKGEKVALIGETGQGKTTILNMVSGIKKLKGLIYLNNIDLNDLSLKSIAEIFSYAFQQPEYMSGDIKRAIFFDTNIDDISFQALTENANHIGFDHLNHKKLQDVLNIKNLSGGEVKRLDLLRIFYFNSEIIILDEPTASLDQKTSEQVWQLIFSIFHDKTIICATHDGTYLKNFDRIFRLEEGVLKSHTLKEH